jgi:hypothetical protein
MRTKALILTAAVGAMSIASSMAQVYSVNAVGYINITCNPGFNLIVNQLTPAVNELQALIPNPPPGTQIYKYSGGNYTLATFDEFDLNWGPQATLSLDLGGGFWINVPPGSPTTITFVGEVPQGTLTTPTPLGFNLVGSKVPQAGPVDTLGLTAGAGDQIYRFANPGGYTLFTFDEFDLAWTPSIPSVGVGEAFWLVRAPGSPANWTRTFTVN